MKNGRSFTGNLVAFNAMGNEGCVSRWVPHLSQVIALRRVNQDHTMIEGSTCATDIQIDQYKIVGDQMNATVRDPMKVAMWSSGCNKSHSVVMVFGGITAFLFLVGCERPPATGGDSPVTTQRLIGIRLPHIHQDISWTFDDNSVVIENSGQSLPPDLVKELIGADTTPKRVEAAWRYDEKSRVLRLSDATADGQKLATELAIPIKPAGHVRINLGSRQYNVFPVKTSNP